MIKEILRPGAENGMLAKTIANKTGLSPREIRAQVHLEREQGAVILSGNTGYFLPSTDPEQGAEELRHFVNKSKKAARELLNSIKGASKLMKEYEAAGQRASGQEGKRTGSNYG